MVPQSRKVVTGWGGGGVGSFGFRYVPILAFRFDRNEGPIMAYLI